jgi:nucleoside-diphosphate-sugar epimerase
MKKMTSFLKVYKPIIYFRFMVLVTGGTGLVGAHLLYHLLLENEFVKAIHRKTSDLTMVKKVFSYYTTDFEKLYSKIIWVEADICDIPSLETAFQDVTNVYHCAALVSFDPKDYHKMRKINIEGTANVVNSCIQNSVKKLCFVSSIAAVEKNKTGKLIDETGNWNSNNKKSDYAISKYGGEMEVWRASQENVEVIIVNPGVILGSGFWHQGTGNLFTKIKNGFRFYTEGVTGFVGVKDVVQIMLQLMQSELKNERFIIVAENKSYKDIFFQIADTFDVKRPNIKVNATLSQIYWRFDYLKSKLTGLKPVLTKATAKSSLSKNYFSSQKIKESLGFEFEPLKKTIQTVCLDFEKEHN